MSSLTDISPALQDFMSTIQAAITNPGDAINIFTQLASFQAVENNTGSAIGSAQTTFQESLADLYRRAAIVALAQVSTYYQPTSFNDAENIRDAVCAIIDNEITIAGDNGQDVTYLALKELRSAVVQDLTTRGATLAPLVTIKMNSSLPAIALAYRLYQDITRTDQLTAFANPAHPLFMPATFQALAS